MKKIIALLIAGVLVFSLSACGPKGITVTLQNEDNTFASEITYPEDAGFTQDGSLDYVFLENAEEDYCLKIIINEDDKYQSSKEWAENFSKGTEGMYKEFELLGYSAYSYYTVSGYNLYLLLEENADGENSRYVSIELETSLGGEATETFFNENKEIQSIVNSFKYIGEANAQE